jgi:hypothetical protein
LNQISPLPGQIRAVNTLEDASFADTTASPQQKMLIAIDDKTNVLNGVNGATIDEMKHKRFMQIVDL